MNCIKTSSKIKSKCSKKISTTHSSLTLNKIKSQSYLQQRKFSTSQTAPPTSTITVTRKEILSPLSSSTNSSSLSSPEQQIDQFSQLDIKQQEFQSQQLQFNLEQQNKQLQFELQQQKAHSDLQLKQLQFEMNQQRTHSEFQLRQQQMKFDLQLKELRLQYQHSLPEQQQQQHLHHEKQQSKQSQLQPQQYNSNDEEQLSQPQQQQFDKIQSQFNQLSTTVQQSLQDQSKQFEQFEQKLISIESLLNNVSDNNNNNNPTQLQTCLTTIEQQRIQVPIILEQNRNLMKDQPPPFVIFQIENYPDIQTSCGSWRHYASIGDIIYAFLIPIAHRTKLKRIVKTIKSSKLYISSKSVLNGEWIQIQGDGAIVDLKEEGEDLQLGDFLKPGDDIYKYDDYQCKECEYPLATDGDDTTINRYIIKFKWE